MGAAGEEGRSASLTIIDVGHGSCAVINDDQTTILIDAGPGSAVLEYLRQEGISKVDLIVLSHSDSDHINGAIALLGVAEFSIGMLVANSDAVKESGAWANLVWDLDNRRRMGSIETSSQLREGDDFPAQVEGAELHILAPRAALVSTGPGSRDPAGRLITSNTMSAVILVAAGDRRVALLTGDLDEVGLEHLFETGQSIQAEILVFPHHGGLAGGPASMAKDFAFKLTAAVQPKEVIFSLDRKRYGTPRPEIIEGVREAAPAARIACTELSEACARELPAEPARHLLPLFARGQDRGACCAGTLRISLGENARVEPTFDLHRAFISQFAETALCIRHLGSDSSPDRYP